MKDNRDAIDFANEPVGHIFRKLLVPTVVGMLSIVILNLTDGAFIGHGTGANGLAAINIAAPIFNILSGIGIMFGIGSSIVISIHLSRREIKAANINVTQAFIGCLGITILCCALILCNLADTCRLFGSSETLVPLASGYLKWISIGSPLMILHMTGTFLIRLDGSPGYAMATSIVGTVLNIFLDWLFIFPLGWGLAGAAKATAISFGIAGLMVVWYFVSLPRTIKLYRLKFSVKSLRLTLRNLGYQMKMGFSAMLGEIAVCGAVIAGNYIFAHYLGDEGVAAYSVACYCFPVIFMTANAIVESAQPIVSFAYGVNYAMRLRESRMLMIHWAVGAGLVCGALMIICAPFVTMLFLDSTEEAYSICVNGLPYFGTGVIFITLNVVIVGYLQSVEQSLKATLLTFLRGYILVIPSFILLPRLLGEVGIWLAIPLAEFLTFVIIFCFKVKPRDRNYGQCK